MKSIDLNSDLGEGMDNDEQMMSYISSANIACGYHAGDESTIKRTIELCVKFGVAVGAHPSFADRANFGRTEMRVPLAKIYDLVAVQVNLIRDLAKNIGARLVHVKPHGALYNMSAKNAGVANTIAQAVKDIDDQLILFGLSNSFSISEADSIGLRSANEIFADRNYQDDGNLIPRSDRHALISDESIMLTNSLSMVNDGTITSLSGKKINVKADTVCIHGDGPHAVAFAKLIHHHLIKNNIAIKAV